MTKPKIPELPKTITKLEELLKQDFNILETSDPVSATHGGKWQPGDIALTIQKRECPFCKMKFQASFKQGCFSHNVTPFACPNCKFPFNVYSALMRKTEENNG